MVLNSDSLINFVTFESNLTSLTYKIRSWSMKMKQSWCGYQIKLSVNAFSRVVSTCKAITHQ